MSRTCPGQVTLREAGEDKEKGKRREEKERDAIAKAAELEPQCRAHVELGIDHVLTLKVPDRRNIIRYHFGLASLEIDGVTKQVYKMTLVETATALKMLMPPMPRLPTNDTEADNDCDVGEGGVSGGDVGGDDGAVAGV